MEELYYIYKDKKAEENIDKLVVHRDKLDTVLYMCHDESGCHLGVNKTVSKIESKYYFPNIIVLNNVQCHEICPLSGQNFYYTS